MSPTTRQLVLGLCGIGLLGACSQGGETRHPQAAAVPVSGFEHTVRFDVAGVHLDVPYGYLYEYPARTKQTWLNNSGKRHAVEPLKIMVAERETLAPYNQTTQHHFKNFDQGTGSDAVSMLIYGQAECENLNDLAAMERLLDRGYTYMSGLPEGYVGFEETTAPQGRKDLYFEDQNERTLLGIRKEEHDGKFVVQAFSCRNQLYVHYYLDYEPQDTFPIHEAIEFNRRLHRLIQSMMPSH